MGATALNVLSTFDISETHAPAVRSILLEDSLVKSGNDYVFNWYIVIVPLEEFGQYDDNGKFFHICEKPCGLYWIIL